MRVDQWTPSALARAYDEISKIQPPSSASLGFGASFADLPLFRSVDPRQYDLVAAICSRRSSDGQWLKVQQMLVDQRPLRQRLFDYLQELNTRRRSGAED